VPDSDIHILLLLFDAFALHLASLEVAHIIVVVPDSQLALAMGLFSLERTFILHVIFLYFAITLAISLFKFALEHHSSFPFVGTVAVRFTFFEGSLEEVAIRKVLLSLAMFEKIEKEPFILLSTFVEMDAIALHFALDPLPHVDISLFRLPNASPMLLALAPLARIVLAIVPMELAHLGALVIDELTLIGALCSDFNSLHLVGARPLPLEHAVLGDEHSLPIHLPLPDLPEVHRLLLLKIDCEVIAPHYRIHINVLVPHLVVLDKL
jgi:hypothetical protein